MENNFNRIQKLIISNLSETRDYWRSVFTILWLLFIVGSIFAIFNFSEFQNIILVIGTWIWSLMLITWNNWLIKKRNLIFQEILSANKYFQKNLKNIDEIGTVLEKIDHMNILLGKMKRNLLFTDMLYSDKIHEEQFSIFKKELLLLLKYMQNLRSDLSIRLTEQQQSLESAKSEVEENIQWTTELKQVSELQKIRLDKQIEQFEELQRVLVKI
jgi:hypothetical protein